MRLITSRYSGKCRTCRKPHAAGEAVYWQKGMRGVLCKACGNKPDGKPSPATPKPAASPATLKQVKGKPVAGVLKMEDTVHGRMETFTVDWADLREQISDNYSGKAPAFSVRENREQYARFYSRDGSSWRGYTPEDAKRWLDRGYQLPGLQFDNPPIPIRERRRFRVQEDGEEFLAELFYSGEDVFTADFSKREVIPGIAVECEIDFSAATDESILKDYFSFLCRAIYALETSGVDCQVTLSSMGNGMYSGSGNTATVVRVKREGEASDFNSWSAMLSPASFRTFMFSALVNHAEAAGKPASYGLGSPLAKGWGVKYNPARGVVEISCHGHGARSFPAEKMEAELREALAAMRQGDTD